MFERQFDRRMLLKGAAVLAAIMPFPARAAAPTVNTVAFDPAIPALGNPKGDVTIAEFVDYQCPICKRAFVELGKLLAEDSGVRLVMKDWPVFGEASRDAARMALSSGPLYPRAIEALMANEHGLSERRTNDVLASAGIDVVAVRAGLDAGAADVDAVLARNDALAVAFQLRGTPALVIGGTLYKRGMHLDELRQAVARARAS